MLIDVPLTTEAGRLLPLVEVAERSLALDKVFAAPQSPLQAGDFRMMRGPDLTVLQEVSRITSNGSGGFDGKILGTVFEDVNLTGKFEDGKSPLRNETVFMDLFGDGFQRNNPVAVTDSEGRFQFDGLPPGEYVVRLVPRANVVQPPQTREGIKVTITAQKPVYDKADLGAVEVRRRKARPRVVGTESSRKAPPPPSAWVPVLSMCGVKVTPPAPQPAEAKGGTGT
jgi:hypothetical protein